jgi:long-chain acyl-CoA synthetase
MVGGKEEKQTKTWTYFKLKPYDWISYEGALQLVQQIGSGLRELGVGGEGETFFNLYAATS